MVGGVTMQKDDEWGCVMKVKQLKRALKWSKRRQRNDQPIWSCLVRVDYVCCNEDIA